MMARRCGMQKAGYGPRRTRGCALVLLAAVAAASPAISQAPAPPWEALPDLAPSWARPMQPAQPAATAKSYMVAAANALAVDAGIELLRAGGSAADAAIGVQLVLNLVEPQSSGLGGGAFALHWH